MSLRQNTGRVVLVPRVRLRQLQTNMKKMTEYGRSQMRRRAEICHESWKPDKGRPCSDSSLLFFGVRNVLRPRRYPYIEQKRLLPIVDMDERRCASKKPRYLFDKKMENRSTKRRYNDKPLALGDFECPREEMPAPKKMPRKKKTERFPTLCEFEMGAYYK